MNASVNIERNSWRLPPDETVQVADPRSKSAQLELYPAEFRRTKPSRASAYTKYAALHKPIQCSPE
ncbi:inactive dipeptidyl peptidase 10 isoform X1 [Vespula maculifrons]|uniref:Inactive dipeptidyl peptidase 10 isoform X1 n=1 Tax=Vespula maculifrons TaxID=7453 RepID=A0ABD2CJ39_VESMC